MATYDMIPILADMKTAFPDTTFVLGDGCIYVNGNKKAPANWSGCKPRWSNIHYMVDKHTDGAPIPGWFWQKYPLRDNEVLRVYGEGPSVVDEPGNDDDLDDLDDD